MPDMTDKNAPKPEDGPEPVENEVLRAAREAKEARKRAEAEDKSTGKSGKGWKAAAAAAGLGSAAVVAALLYSRKDK